MGVRQRRCLTWVTPGFRVVVALSSGCLLADQDLPERSCNRCQQEPSFARKEGQCVAETSETSDSEGPEHWLHVQPTPGGHLPIIACSCTHLDCTCVDLPQITPRHCARGDEGMCIVLPVPEPPALRPFPLPAWEVMHGGYGWLHLHLFHMQKPTFLAVQLWSEPRGVNGVCRGSLASGSTACMEEAPEMQPNRSEQEARVPGTTWAVPWQRGREASSGNGVTWLAPAPLAGTKRSFILPGQPPVPAPTFPLHLDTSPLLPAAAPGPARCWHPLQTPSSLPPPCLGFPLCVFSSSAGSHARSSPSSTLSSCSGAPSQLTWSWFWCRTGV